MTPWKKRESREPKDSRPARDDSMDAEAAELDAELRAEMGEQYDDFTLITDYLEGDMSSADMDRVEERLRTDQKFHELAAPSILLWSVPFSNRADLVNPDLLERVERSEAELSLKKLKGQIELARQGIKISPLVKGRPYRRRASPGKLLDACNFQQRFAAALGGGSELVPVECACLIIQDTGNPDRWIGEVRNARERGAITPEFAEFLILKLAESALAKLVRTHPVLCRINEEIERVELAQELDEDESPRLEVLQKEGVTVIGELVLEIFLRNGEQKLAENTRREMKDLT